MVDVISSAGDLHGDGAAHPAGRARRPAAGACSDARRQRESRGLDVTGQTHLPRQERDPARAPARQGGRQHQAAQRQEIYCTATGPCLRFVVDIMAVIKEAGVETLGWSRPLAASRSSAAPVTLGFLPRRRYTIRRRCQHTASSRNAAARLALELVASGILHGSLLVLSSSRPHPGIEPRAHRRDHRQACALGRRTPKDLLRARTSPRHLRPKASLASPAAKPADAKARRRMPAMPHEMSRLSDALRRMEKASDEPVEGIPMARRTAKSPPWLRHW